MKTASSSLIIFQTAKLSTRSITRLCWCNWRKFWRKNAAGMSPSWSCSCTTMPQLTEHLQPRRNWASNVLITHPIFRIWPRRTTTCSLAEKKVIERSSFYVRRGDLVGPTNFWIFFWLYWASSGVCWINPELVALACFLPSGAKDLSAPPHNSLSFAGPPNSEPKFLASSEPESADDKSLFLEVHLQQTLWYTNILSTIRRKKVNLSMCTP